MLQHPLERPAVEGDGAVEHPLGRPIEPRLGARVGDAQELRAHHRRQRQRHHGGDEDRHAQRDGELPEQPADDVAHEEQGNQHGDQGHGEGHDGESDLLGALEGGLER